MDKVTCENCKQQFEIEEIQIWDEETAEALCEVREEYEVGCFVCNKCMLWIRREDDGGVGNEEEHW